MRAEARLRVCQVITKLEIGGAQETVMATAEHFAGHPMIELVTLAGTEDASGGALWARARDQGLDVRSVPRLRRSVRPGDDLAAMAALREAFRSIQPDVVHTHSSKAGVIGRLAARREGIPVVHTVHGWSSIRQDQNPVVRSAVVALERWLARRTDRLVVVTDLDRSIGLAAGIGTDEQYTLVRSPLAPEVVARAVASRAASRAELGIEPGQVVVGSVARLAPPKDPDTLLQAFVDVAAVHPTAVLVLIGGGPRLAEVTATAASLGLADRVRVVGERPDAALLTGAFDIAVLSSRWEGLPRTVIEAAAVGVPVVATPVGGVPEIIEDEVTGLLFAPGDSAALGRALSRLIEDPVLRRRLAEAARDRVDDDFTPEGAGRRLAHQWTDTSGVVPAGEVVGAP